MRKGIFIVSGVLVFVLSLAGCSQSTVQQEAEVSESTLQAVASFFPLAFFAEQVGGSNIQVKNVTPTGAEPHDFEPSPRDLAEIEKADLFLFMGQGFDPWAEEFSQQLTEEGPEVIEVLEEGIDLIAYNEEEHEEHEEEDHRHSHEESDHDHEHEDEDHEKDHDEEEEHHHEGEYDPHIWLDPVRAQQIVQLIAQKLSEIDSENSAVYSQQAQNVVAELQDLDQQFQQGLASCQLKTAIVSHDAFQYLGDRYNIEFIGISGLSPQAEVSARRMAELTDLARDNNIQYIFFESLVSPKVSTTLAEEVGIETLVLNPLEGLTKEEIDQGKGYTEVMQQNLENLKKALACQ